MEINCDGFRVIGNTVPDRRHNMACDAPWPKERAILGLFAGLSEFLTWYRNGNSQECPCDENLLVNDGYAAPLVEDIARGIIGLLSYADEGRLEFGALDHTIRLKMMQAGFGQECDDWIVPNKSINPSGGSSVD